MGGKLLLASVACVLFLAPFQARADATFTMTAFQSLGPEYASGEIYFTLNNVSSPFYYSFCVDNTRTIYQGTPYYAVFAPISGNTGLLETAYLMNTYAPSKAGRTAVPGITDITRQGVALQWAIWMVTGQDQVPALQNLINDQANADIKAAAIVLASQANGMTNLANYTDGYTQMQLWDTKADYLANNTANERQYLIAPVPVPGAIWLLGSGLMGLLGMRRKIAD